MARTSGASSLQRSVARMFPPRQVNASQLASRESDDIAPHPSGPAAAQSNTAPTMTAGAAADAAPPAGGATAARTHADLQSGVTPASTPVVQSNGRAAAADATASGNPPAAPTASQPRTAAQPAIFDLIAYLLSKECLYCLHLISLLYHLTPSR